MAFLRKKFIGSAREPLKHHIHNAYTRQRSTEYDPTPEQLRDPDAPPDFILRFVVRIVKLATVKVDPSRVQAHLLEHDATKHDHLNTVELDCGHYAHSVSTYHACCKKCKTEELELKTQEKDGNVLVAEPEPDGNIQILET